MSDDIAKIRGSVFIGQAEKDLASAIENLMKVPIIYLGGGSDIFISQRVAEILVTVRTVKAKIEAS